MTAPERHLVTASCKLCGRPVYADEGYHAVSQNHYDCEHRERQAFEQSVKRLDGLMAEMTGRSKPRMRVGEGKPTAKLVTLIEASAREQFGEGAISDVKVFLPPPVWRQYRFDVMRVEGSLKINGIPIGFGSWAAVTELIKYRRLKFDGVGPVWDLSPVYETRRRRKASIGATNAQAIARGEQP
ncbi:MAG: hypothetical protein ACYC3W_02360 [Candidatus Nanopelagicales bacterium]